jgi:type 2 lantibiotic biosynthesis protein LanM
MQLERDELHILASKAKSLLERMQEYAFSQPVENSKFKKWGEARLHEWCDVVADGNEDMFIKRLSYDGLDLNSAKSLLCGRQSHNRENLPSWTEDLNEILNTIANFHNEKLDGNLIKMFPFLKKDKPYPFEELFLPIIQLARQKLMHNTKSTYDLVPEKAHQSMERFLLFRLSEISCRVLEVEFNTYMASLQITDVSYTDMTANKESRTHYLDFIKSLQGGQLLNIFKEYCVLARMLVLSVNQWVQLTVEFLGRLKSDHKEIGTAFFNSYPESIEDLDPGLSDSHCNGRTVIILRFKSGTKVVYKPKDMGLEAGYFQFVSWLNEQGVPLDFKVLRVINRVSYGWVEFAEHLPMENEDQPKRFFRRSGLFLGLLYAFDGIDFHHENVVAKNEYPIPIDLETFFHHQIKYPKDVQDLTTAANELIRKSVLKTDFLPQLYKMKGKFMDITGMGAVPGQEVSVKILRWENINTDAMKYKFDTVQSSGSQNRPKIGEDYLAPEDYTEEIVEGFEWMVRFIMARRTSFLEEGGIASKLFKYPARFIFRPTALYTSILKKITHPDYQRDGIDLGIQLEILSRPLILLDEKSLFWPLVKVEEREMYEMDVPKFTVSGESDFIEFTDGTKTKSCFSDSPKSVVKKKINGLTEKGLAWQVQLIRWSMEARELRKPQGLKPPSIKVSSTDEIPLLSKDQLIKNAIILAREIMVQAVYSDKKEPSWVTLQAIPETKQFILKGMQFSLYDGNLGPALFLAGLNKITPNLEFRKMAYLSIALMRRWVKKVRPADIREVGVGGLSGLGSLVYSLTRLSQFLDDPDLLDEARFVASLFHKENIDLDKQLDILGGAAGGILGLLVLYKETGDQELFNMAVYCGKHLLKKRIGIPSGFKVWQCLDGSPPLCGFSHGAAGISYALLKLYQVAGQASFLQAAKDAIAFETAEFDSETKNWPDYRVKEEGEKIHKGLQFMTAWCNGAPGIGFGRLGSLDILNSEGIQKDIQIALETTRDFAYQPSDHLCCGNSGRAEFMLAAGMKLNELEWKQEALKLTSKIIFRSRKNGGIRPNFNSSIYNPSLFQGASGLGYHLLRLVEPEQFPSPLILE